MIRHKNDRFQVYGQRDGKKVYVGTYDSKREAKAAEEDFRSTQRKIESGELPPAVDTKRTFGMAVDAWLLELERQDSRSFDEYTQRVKKHLRPAFGPMPLVNIRKSDIIQWRDDANATIGAATVNTILGTLSSAFSFFVGRDWIDRSPCTRVKKLKAKTKVFPWIQSTEGITRLLGECPPAIRNIIAVLVGTGMRLDEGLHLKWDDIDLEHRLITVHRGRQGTTKSGKNRRVPIFDAVLPVLKAMKLARGKNSHLWPSPARAIGGAERALTQSAVRHPFKRALKAADMPPTFRLHDLRHTFASLFLIDGGDIFKLSKILGHSSVAITEKTYAHLKPDAFEADYGRVSFKMPSDAKILQFAP